MKPHKPPTPIPEKQITIHTTQKWASFAYVGKETSYITNIFKRIELKIALRTTYKLDNLLTHEDHAHDKYSQSGVYKLTCPDCHKTYVGQTGSRYEEHKTTFRSNSYTSSFAQHLIEEAHSFGLINNIMPRKKSPPQHNREIPHPY
jgi:hypothetical protein